MIRSKLISYSILVLAGMTLFASRFGWKILNPFFISWLQMRETDRCSDFLNWLYYKDSPVSFPFGIMQGFAFPQETPVIFTSFVPLMGIPAKGIDYLFQPGTWQYLGWWLLLCWMLQGIFAYHILRTVGIKNRYYLSLGTVFFWLVPSLLNRYDHTSLCAHWVVLGCILLILKQDLPFKRKIGFWVLLSTLSLLIHPYFILFTAASGLPIVWNGFRKNKWSLQQVVLAFLFFTLSTVSVLGLFGYFSLPAGTGEEAGFGHYSANINSFFNSFGKTNAPFDLPRFTSGQYEGYSYLGLGAILLLGLSVGIGMLRPRIMYSFLREHYPLLILAFLLFCFSLSNVISWNRQSVTIPLPDPVLGIASIFRSSGRYIWMLHYVILLIVLFTISRAWYKKPALGIFTLLTAIFIQVWDISPLLAPCYPSESNFEIGQTIPQDPIREAFSNADRIMVYPPYARTLEEIDDHMDFLYVAHLAGRPITSGHLPRFNRELMSATIDSVNACLERGHFDWFDRTLWVFSDRTAPLFKDHIASRRMEVFRSDPYYIGFPPDVSPPQSLIESEAFERGNLRFEHLTDYLAQTDFSYLLIAAQDEATNRLDERAKNYFTNLGSTIGELAFRGSWAAVFSKEKVLVEEIKNRYDGPASATTTLELSGREVPVKVVSAGMDAGNFSVLEFNGKNLSPQKRGLNMVLLNKKMEPLSVIYADTYLSSFISAR